MMCRFGTHGLNGSFSEKAKQLGFKDEEDLRTFFSSQFEPGMTFENHGKQRIDGPRMWHIGHKFIPQCAYDRESAEDTLRCFHKTNLMPQWANENMSQGTKMPPDAVLLEHKALWPTAWGDKLPSAQLRAKIERRRFVEAICNVDANDVEAVLDAHTTEVFMDNFDDSEDEDDDSGPSNAGCSIPWSSSDDDSD